MIFLGKEYKLNIKLSKINKSTVLEYTPMMQVKFVWHWDRRKKARYQIVKIHNEIKEILRKRF